MKSLLVVPIQASEPREVTKFLKRRLPRVDAFEIWLDQLKRKYQKPEAILELVRIWRKLTRKKLIFVCKEKYEGGKFSGFARQKVDLLISASLGGANYVDISINTGKNQILRLKEGIKRSKLIISWHDFMRTPNIGRLEKIVKRMTDMGADLVKIATAVESVKDNETLMQLALDLKKNHIKHIIIGMGTLGVTMRVFSGVLGNEFNFVTLDKSTAPGQLTLDEMLQFRKVLPK